MKKLLIIGHGRHGKDTVCEILKDKHSFSFVSSSYYLAQHVMWPILKDRYENVEECYNDRHNHRKLWADTIDNVGLVDIMKSIITEYDIYCGLRNVDDFYTVKEQGVFDIIVGVDASKRIEYRDPTFKIPLEESDVIIDNNGTPEELIENIDQFVKEYCNGI